MEITAKLKNLRRAPRKVRLVANLIKGMDAIQAENELKFSVKDSAKPLLKLLKSAVANAENNFHLEKNNLYISKITVDGGPGLKRWRPRAFGRAAQVIKRTSHINIVLAEKVEGKIKKAINKKSKEAINKENEKVKIDLSKEDKKQDKKFDFKKEDTKLKKQSKAGIKKIFRRKSI